MMDGSPEDRVMRWKPYETTRRERSYPMKAHQNKTKYLLTALAAMMLLGSISPANAAKPPSNDQFRKPS
jgi:hypothetical protein